MRYLYIKAIKFHMQTAKALVLVVALLFPLGACAQSETHDALRSGFETPPDSAKPRVWWHWLSGNISQQGITHDLEWMKSVGIGGMQMFDGELGAQQVVERKVAALSQEWTQALQWTAREADRLGLEFSMAAAPGWSETGGPWVTPEQGMKKLVWAYTQMTGGVRFHGKLRMPPVATGAFQAMRGRDMFAREVDSPVPAYYRDVAVLAFKMPASERPLQALHPQLSASADGLDLAALIDGNLDAGIVLPEPTSDAPSWVRFAFAAPQTIRALTYVGPTGSRLSSGPHGRIEASDDGVRWRMIRHLVNFSQAASPQRTFAFPATSARYFQVVFDAPEISNLPFPRPPGIKIGELVLVPGARIDQFEDKAGYGVHPTIDRITTPDYALDEVIAAQSMIDLTGRLEADGTLDWTPPAGDWMVLRFGYSPTGTINHPATPEATGPEVDKFNAEHVRAHLEHYLRPVLEQLGPLAGQRGLGYLLTDSWEAGNANWTEAMLDEFQYRRGYDLKPWLPVLAGYVLGSAHASDAVAWDFRRTLADLLAENHYGTIRRFAREHRLGYYGEAVGAGWPTVADGIQAKGQTDIPMGEFWALPFGADSAVRSVGVGAKEFQADIIEAASAAHVYGKPLVAAESLTSSLPLWRATPWNLKSIVDLNMALGVNRVVIHTSPHQPDDHFRPGMTLGPFGQAFTRHETWAGMARAWVDYLARTSFLLQQGTPVADILYFYGEGAPSGVPYREATTPTSVPGYNLDYVNADALLHLAQVKDGQIGFPGGAAYQLLVLPSDLTQMTLPLAEKLYALVSAGAVLVGPKPQGSPSLMFADEAVRAVTDALWGPLDGHLMSGREVGKGRVYSGLSPQAVLQAERIGHDFDYDHSHGQFDLRFAHRRLPDADIYFISNQSDASGIVNTRFRASGRKPWLWHADTGTIAPVSYQVQDGYTKIALPLDAYEAVFVVFRTAASSGEELPAATVSTLHVLDGHWTLQFSAGLGAPTAPQPLTKLGSWTDSEIAGIRYFSGVARYRRTLTIPANWKKENACIVLDLGTVGELAEVHLNGQSVGIAWKPPYRVDVTDAITTGSNQLDIDVANVWWNRMIGDQQPGAHKIAATTALNDPIGSALATPFSAATALIPAGLLGPVSVLETTGGRCLGKGGAE